MFCGICNQDVRACKCPDIEERLEKVASSPHVHIPKCEQCHKLIYFCLCENKARSAGA